MLKSFPVMSKESHTKTRKSRAKKIVKSIDRNTCSHVSLSQSYFFKKNIRFTIRQGMFSTFNKYINEYMLIFLYLHSIFLNQRTKAPSTSATHIFKKSSPSQVLGNNMNKNNWHLQSPACSRGWTKTKLLHVWFV